MGKLVFNDKNYSGEPNPINDSIISTNTTWSSDKINNKMDKSNPTGTGSFSLNRKANTTVGTNSVAVGTNTTASASNAHAEGSSTTASAAGAHAEGYDTVASGPNGSHAEGYGSHAEGLASHAENNGTATGDYSHAEGGSSTASGIYSHAEGNHTTASGSSSHAEGAYTIAKGPSQHAGGKFNVADNNNTYAEIIGNGTSNNARSNARTLDWSGNESLAGTIDASGFGTRLSALIPADPGIPTPTVSDIDKVIKVESDGQGGAQYTLGTGGSAETEIPGTLAAGASTVTLQNAAITTSSKIDYYAEVFGVHPINAVVTTGQIVLTYRPRATAVNIKVVVS